MRQGGETGEGETGEQDKWGGGWNTHKHAQKGMIKDRRIKGRGMGDEERMERVLLPNRLLRVVSTPHKPITAVDSWDQPRLIALCYEENDR